MMFRRRPIGPGRRPAERAAALLAQAHRLFDEGQYQRAGKLFEELASGAKVRNLPRAPFLYLQAGRAYILGGDLKGIGLAWTGLELLTLGERWVEMEREGKRLVAELSEHGYTEASHNIQNWLDEKLAGVKDQTPGEEKPVVRPALPTKCPSCGSSIDPQVAIWLDGVTVECRYCGSAVRAEN